MVYKHQFVEMKKKNTDRYVGVFVEYDLKKVRRENRRGFETFLRPEDVLFLSIRTRRRAGQICHHTHREDSMNLNYVIFLLNVLTQL